MLTFSFNDTLTTQGEEKATRSHVGVNKAKELVFKFKKKRERETENIIIIAKTFRDSTPTPKAPRNPGSVLTIEGNKRGSWGVCSTFFLHSPARPQP